MLLKYNSVYDLAIFPEVKLEEKESEFFGKYYVSSKDSKPYLKPEYFKTYYCIKYLKEDWFSTLDCGWMSKEEYLYKKGYYVIPCYLSAHRWICGNKIVLHKRDFCYMFGDKPREYEPQDVKKEDWWIAAKFKRYWGLVQERDHFGYLEDYELYDDVHEAISRARELDKLIHIQEKYVRSKNRLANAKRLYDNANEKIKSLNRRYPLSRRAELELEMLEIAQDKRTDLIKRLEKEKETLEIKKNSHVEFNKVLV